MMAQHVTSVSRTRPSDAALSLVSILTSRRTYLPIGAGRAAPEWTICLRLISKHSSDVRRADAVASVPRAMGQRDTAPGRKIANCKASSAGGRGRAYVLRVVAGVLLFGC